MTGAQNAAADADFAAVAAGLDGFTHGGVSVVVTEATPELGSGSLQLRGEFRAGAMVGGFSRMLIGLPDGRRRANHMRMELDHQARGGSFADAFIRESERLYRQHGINEMTLSAEEVGSYLWAKYGFVLAGAESDKLQKIAELSARADALLPTAIANGLPQAEADVIRARFAASSSGSPLEPPEIAAFGKGHAWTSDGRPVWLGKLTLVGAKWNGYKLL